jgi:DNA-binding MarR family transcriptional regulator
MTEFDANMLVELAKSFEEGGPVGRLRHKYHLSGRAILKSLLEARRRELVSKVSLARVLIRRKEFRFPSNPEARFKGILGCMNTELKQALLLTTDWYPRTYIGLYNKLAAITSIDLPCAQVIDSYCVDTLTPAGILTMELFGRGLRYAERNFRLNQPGAKYGQPIAAFSIKYAVDHGVSLYELLGQTQSAGASIAPCNRVRIVELVSAGYNKIVDLTDRLGLVIEDIREHLDRMSKLKILTYDSLNFEKKGMKLYRWVDGKMPGKAKIVRELKKLTHDVETWLYRNKAGERNQIAESLGYQHVNHVSTILSGLVRQGLVETQFTSSNKSHIVLLERSRLILDYSDALRDALGDGVVLTGMREILEKFRRDKHVFTKYLDAGIDLYCQVSPNINKRSLEERETNLLEFIRSFQERNRTGARPVDAVRSLGWTHGTVTRCLHSLLKKGDVERARKGPATRYQALG